MIASAAPLMPNRGISARLATNITAATPRNSGTRIAEATCGDITHQGLLSIGCQLS